MGENVFFVLFLSTSEEAFIIFKYQKKVNLDFWLEKKIPKFGFSPVETFRKERPFLKNKQNVKGDKISVNDIQSRFFLNNN